MEITAQLLLQLSNDDDASVSSPPDHQKDTDSERS